VPAMDFTGEGYIATVIANQNRMFDYHVDLVAEHPFASRWWQWPIMAIPIFYYVNVVSDTVRQGISSFGNPALWWAGIPATLFAIYVFAYDWYEESRKFNRPPKGKKSKNKQNKSGKPENPTKPKTLSIFIGKSKDERAILRLNLMFLLIAYGAQFLPWVAVSRLTFIYHYFPSVPFVILLIVLCFKEYIAPKYPRLMWGYAALVVALFALFYPVLSATPVSVWFVHNVLRWFPGWVLV